MIEEEENHNPILCECGCGQPAPINNRGKQMRFIHGHNGRCISKESLIARGKKISEVNKIRMNDPEIKKKQSDNQLILWSDPEYRESQIKAIGRPESKANRAKHQKETNQNTDVNLRRSQSVKKSWDDPLIREDRLTNLRLATNTPEIKLKRKETTEETWKDPQIRDNRLRGMIKAQNLPETKLKISEADKKKWADPEYKIRTSAAIKEALNCPEVKERACKIQKEINSRPGIKEAKSRRMKITWEDPKYRAKMLQALSISQNRPEVVAKISKASLLHWQDPIWKEKQLGAMGLAMTISPNKPELLILNQLNQLYPTEWKFTGDLSFIIGGKNPDFVNINGQKKCIEHYGTYWHQEDLAQDRINLFAEYGWDCLIIWEYELTNLTKLRRKLFEFCEKG